MGPVGARCQSGDHFVNDGGSAAATEGEPLWGFGCISHEPKPCLCHVQTFEPAGSRPFC
jgi:hypothetical protein